MLNCEYWNLVQLTVLKVVFSLRSLTSLREGFVKLSLLETIPVNALQLNIFPT